MQYIPDPGSWFQHVVSYLFQLWYARGILGLGLGLGLAIIYGRQATFAN